jgi:hypothetical protein
MCRRLGKRVGLGEGRSRAIKSIFGSVPNDRKNKHQTYADTPQRLHSDTFPLRRRYVSSTFSLVFGSLCAMFTNLWLCRRKTPFHDASLTW